MSFDNPAALGRALQARRKQLRLTQLDLAELVGVSVRFLSDLERGKPTVQLGMVISVARALGYQIDLALAGAES